MNRFDCNWEVSWVKLPHLEQKKIKGDSRARALACKCLHILKQGTDISKCVYAFLTFLVLCAQPHAFPFLLLNGISIYSLLSKGQLILNKGSKSALPSEMWNLMQGLCCQRVQLMPFIQYVPCRGAQIGEFLLCLILPICSTLCYR